MASQQNDTVEPRGFGEHSRGLAGEYAHEQGWGLNIPERSRQSTEPQDTDGGTDYEYGARDFGDEPVNTAPPPDISTPGPAPITVEAAPPRKTLRSTMKNAGKSPANTSSSSSEHARPQHGEEKKHGDQLREAAQTNRPIPAPDNGGHALSPAAHLEGKGSQHDHTKPVGDLRHYEREREPPQEVSRAGKEYRRQ